MTVEERLTAVESSTKSAHHRLNEVERKMDDLQTLTKAVFVTAEKVDHLRGDMDEVRRDVKIISNRGGRLWDKIVAAAATALAAALVAALLALIMK